MPFHDTPSPSVERQVYDRSLEEFSSILFDESGKFTDARKDDVLRSMAQLVVSGIDAVGSGSQKYVTYGLPPLSFSLDVLRTFTRISDANERGLIHPPFSSDELLVVDSFIKTATGTTD